MFTYTPYEDMVRRAARVNHHWRVETKNPDGVWQDLGSFGGDDYAIGATWGEKVDTRIATATVRIRRSQNSASKSLAPLMTTSLLNRNAALAYAPALDMGRDIRIFTAITPPGQRPGTNLIKWSEDHTQAVWAKTGGGTGTAPVVTAGYTLAPDGVSMADRVQFALGSGVTSADLSLLAQSVTPSIVGQSYIHSCWLKTNDGTTKVVSLYVTSAGSSRVTVTPQWQRFTSIVFVAPSTTGVTSQVRLRGTDGTDTTADLAIWGHMVEVGTVASAYVKTQATGGVSGWKEKFSGRINRINWDNDPIVVECSDLASWLMDTQIETESQFGGAVGVGQPVQTVIQNVLNAWPSGKGVPTLVTPVSPGWQVELYTQARVKVFEAALALVIDRFGWDLRYRYDANGVNQLTLLNPDRTKATVDAVFTPYEYDTLSKIQVDLADVRNVGKTSYEDASGVNQVVTASDAASIAKVGRRFFELPKNPNLRTAGEAQALIDNATSDLAQPPFDHVVDLRYFDGVQLYDRYTFGANGVHYDTDQTLAIVGYSHTAENGQILTTFECAGKISGGYAHWLQRLNPSGEDLPPSLDVRVTPGAANYTIVYKSSAPVELSIDGLAFTTAPASPIIVTRPGPGLVDKVYVFRSTSNVQTVTDEVHIPAVDKDTVTPDLAVLPSAPTITTQDFTVTATNPVAGGPTPAITFTPRGTSAVKMSTLAVIPDGVTASLSPGEVMQVARPPFGTVVQASIEFTASLTGGGTERIQRSIPNQVKNSFGPTLDVTATAAPSQYTIAYTGTPTLKVNGTPTTLPGANPFTVTRPGAGGTPLEYAFSATADGQTVTNSVVVLPIDQDTNTVNPDLVVTQVNVQNTYVDYTVSATNPVSGGPTPAITFLSTNLTATKLSTLAVIPAGTPASLSSGETMRIVRPPFDTAAQGLFEFFATLPGGGTERIQRSVLNQVKTSFGPTLDVTATASPSQYTIAYTGTPTLTINGVPTALPGANPFTVPRPGAGGTPLEYAFSATLDGQTVTNSVVVLPVDKDTITPNLTVTPTTFDPAYVIYSASATTPGGGPAPDIYAKVVGTTGGYGSPTTPMTAGVEYLVSAGGAVVNVGADRPLFDTALQASLVIRAVTTSGAQETISRSVLNRVKTSFGPTLDVTGTASPSQYSIAYTGTPTMKVNGTTTALPGANPFTVPRPGAGGTPLEYSFSVTLDGQTVTDSIVVLPLDQDTNTVTPDLAISPANPTATYQEFGTSASNPAGGAAPALTVIIRGTTGLNVSTGVTIPANTLTSFTSGQGIRVLRPAFDTVAQASVEFVASLSGGGSERIQRSILNQVKTSFGPSLVVTPTPGPSQYSITYSGTYDTLTLAINGVTTALPGTNPFTVTRTASELTYTFKATRDGVDVVQNIVIPPAAPPTAVIDRLFITSIDYIGNSIAIGWAYSGSITGGFFQVLRIAQSGSTPDLSATPTNLGTTTGTTKTDFVSEDLVSGAGPKYTYSYMIQVVDASLNVIRSSIWTSTTQSTV